jgi:hypothetical protein
MIFTNDPLFVPLRWLLGRLRPLCVSAELQRGPIRHNGAKKKLQLKHKNPLFTLQTFHYNYYWWSQLIFLFLLSVRLNGFGQVIPLLVWAWNQK